MENPEYRPRGSNDILYANKKYKKVYLQDCLDTVDPRIASRRLLQLMIEVDEGRYHIGKALVSAKGREEIGPESKQYDDCIALYFNSLDKDREKGIVKEEYYYNERALANKHIIRSKAFDGLTIRNILQPDSVSGLSPLQSFFAKLAGKPRDSVKVVEGIIRQADNTFIMLSHFPQKDAKKKPKLPGGKGFYQTRFLTESQLTEIIERLDERFRDLATLLAYSGLDLSEGINLTWGEIDRGARLIVRNRDKNLDQSRRIPIRGQLEKMLKMRFLLHSVENPEKKVASSQRVFNFPRHGYSRSQLKRPDREFQRAWKIALDKSTIDWNVRPKDLRHFFGSTMLNRGANPMEIANQMGHASVEMLIKRYGHYSVDRLHEASKVWDQVEDPGMQIVCKQEKW